MELERSVLLTPHCRNKGAPEMLTLKAAQDLIAAQVRPLPAVRVLTCEATGRRLAESVSASVAWPAADVSQMDGYAVRAADLQAGVALPVAFEVAAGQVPNPLPPQECARIFTGASLPLGADTVVPQEDVQQAGQRVQLPDCERGSYVRRRGEVCQEQSELTQAGALVTPQLLGLLIAAGPLEVSVVPEPRVGILTTGAELLPPTASLEPGKIRDSNGPMLAALVREAGLTPVQVRRVSDSPHEIAQALSNLRSECDLILTNGGVSVGDHDFLPEVIRHLGGEVVFHRISIRPGKPTLTAKLGETWLVGLPGNPASAFVGWHVLALPLARRLAGSPPEDSLRFAPGTLREPISNRGQRTALAPVEVQWDEGRFSIRPLTWRGSHDILALARANGLLIIEPGTTLAAGSVAEFLPLTARWT
jgi:molybdopterin molybdotransferase